MAIGIIVGYLVYLGLRVFGRRTAIEPALSVAIAPSLATSAKGSATQEFNAIATSTAIPNAKVPAGELPAWETAELPAPPSFNWRNIIAIIGTGAILLGTSIGSGEWLLGPAVTSQYGGSLLWLATASIILQVIMNAEFVRYTMYTGEPIYTGFIRTKPVPTFWAIVYSLLAFLQLGWPGWASSAATALTAMFIGQVPGPEHTIWYNSSG